MSESKSEKRRVFECEALPHLDCLFTTALYLTRNEEEANDLCQETMLRAYRSFHQFTVGTNCRAWLQTILHNLFRTVRSRAKPERVLATGEEFERAIETESLKAADGSADPETIVAGRSFDQSIRTALQDLPADFKAALILVDMEDMSYKEAASVLEVPIGTVRSRVSRGRALMRHALRFLIGERRLAGMET